MLGGILSGSSVTVGKMVKGFTARAFDMQKGKQAGNGQQTLAPPAAQRLLNDFNGHRTSQSLYHR